MNGQGHEVLVNHGVGARSRRTWFVQAGLAGLSWAAGAAAAQQPERTVIRVGPDHAIKTLGEAAHIARDGSLVLVQAGTYRGDQAVAVWTQGDVAVRSQGGRVRLLAANWDAESKGIWVTRGTRLQVQGFDFEGCKVPDRNGAGIRHERGHLIVRECRFLHNENGILTGNHLLSTLELYSSEFGFNGHGDGQSHNVYAGHIAQLKVHGCWFHHANKGHLLKSRAMHSQVAYNALVDGPGGRASYELEFPNGKQAVVVGNLIGQSTGTDNRTMLSYGAEGLQGRAPELFVLHNTFVDERWLGGRTMELNATFSANALAVANNVFIDHEPPKIAATAAAMLGNVRAKKDDFEYDSQTAIPGRPKREAPWLNQGASLPEALQGLAPTHEYQAPTGLRELTRPAKAPGALQPP